MSVSLFADPFGVANQEYTIVSFLRHENGTIYVKISGAFNDVESATAHMQRLSSAGRARDEYYVVKMYTPVTTRPELAQGFDRLQTFFPTSERALQEIHDRRIIEIREAEQQIEARRQALFQEESERRARRDILLRCGERADQVTMEAQGEESGENQEKLLAEEVEALSQYVEAARHMVEHHRGDVVMYRKARNNFVDQLTAAEEKLAEAIEQATKSEQTLADAEKRLQEAKERTKAVQRKKKRRVGEPDAPALKRNRNRE